MELKPVVWKMVLSGLVGLGAGGGCQRHSSVREPPIIGTPSDGPVALRATWQPGQRYVYRVETETSSQVPQRNTGKFVRAETTLGQDLAFTVTNTISDGSRVLQMEILAVQMETARDDGVTLSFDSDNKAVFADDSPLTARLQKLVGLRLAFQVSPENNVLRVDGGREMADRLSGNNNVVRGAAGGVMGRFFSPQFFKDLVEMGMLPKDPVKVGDTWTVSRQANAGLWGTSALIELTYKFRGWQQHDGTNCARLDFSGTFKPNNVSRTNQTTLRRVAAAGNSSNVEEGTITGRSWFNPEIALAVETIYDQSITTKSTTVRRQRLPAGTNAAPVIEPLSATNAPPPPPTNIAPQTVTSTTTTKTQQHTSIKLVEAEPLEK